jgi:hypothetical protein
MKLCKRVVAGLALILGAAGLLLSLVGGIGVWIVKEPVTTRATQVFGRIQAALDVAEQGLDHVETSLGRATERLEGVREEQRKLAQEPPKTGAVGRLLARTVQQRVAPELGDAHETLHTVAEAAVVVNSVLEDMGNFPFLSVTGLDVERLTELNNRLAGVGPAAWELSRLLGTPGPEPDSDSASTQLSRIEQTVKTTRSLLAQYQLQVTQVRQRTEDLKSRTLPWITPGAVLVSFACFWVALSQVSLLSHAWSWWRQLDRNESPAEVCTT